MSEGQSEIGILSGVMSDFFSTDRNIFRSESQSRSNDSCPSTGNFSRRQVNKEILDSMLHDRTRDRNEAAIKSKEKEDWHEIQESRQKPKEGDQMTQLKQ